MKKSPQMRLEADLTHRWTIGFDADDTLWHNERFFRMTQDRFADLLAGHVPPDDLRQRLMAAERRNLGAYGFGIKGFVLSMIETAIDVTEGQVPSNVIAALLEAGKDMLRHPIDLLPQVHDTVAALSGHAVLILITKGDLLDQERKLAQSGLGDYFDDVQIVSDKTVQTYTHIFARTDTARAMMVGNSLKSDVIPAIEAGALGTWVPHDLTWEYESAEAPVAHTRFHEISSLGDLPALLDRLG